AEYRSSSGRDGRSLGRTQGASISVDMGATENGARGRAARPDGTDCISPNSPWPPVLRAPRIFRCDGRQARAGRSGEGTEGQGAEGGAPAPAGDLRCADEGTAR